LEGVDNNVKHPKWCKDKVGLLSHSLKQHLVSQASRQDWNLSDGNFIATGD
jgi:hypothetical protein